MTAFMATSAAATHIGHVRRLNEDAFLDRPDLGLWVVADGMGGHAAGDVASRHIVTSLGRIAPPADAARFIADIRDSVDRSNLDLLEEGRRRGVGIVVGSTVVVLLAFGAFYACLWAGDSRAYRWRNGRLEQLTVDHSKVQEMVDAGLLTPEAAEFHPYANVITRAVGTDRALELDKVTDRLAANDVYLLCSDGLTKMVADDQIAEILQATPFASLPDALIAAALDRGGRDNVTVVAVGFGERAI